MPGYVRVFASGFLHRLIEERKEMVVECSQELPILPPDARLFLEHRVVSQSAKGSQSEPCSKLVQKPGG